jgi:hypothetical protein
MTEAELQEIIDARVAAALAKQPETGLKPWLLGAVKSLTIWWTAALGTIIAAWPEIKALLEESVFPAMSEEAKTRWARIFGIVVAVIGIIIRNRTTQSLKEKGTK